MSKTIYFVGHNIKHYCYMKVNQLQQWISRYWFKIGLLILAIVMLNKKDLNLELSLSANPEPAKPALVSLNHHQGVDISKEPIKQKTTPVEEAPAPQTSTMDLGPGLIPSMKLERSTISEEELYEDKLTRQKAIKNNLSNTYSNMTYHGSDLAEKKLSPKKRRKIRKQRAYVERFAHVAQAEMRKYGIPASIKLAQGLIESNAGESRLSSKNHNHFGMKCFSRNCRKGHCSNFTDDSHKDFFRIYKSAWESYRAHSKMLGNKKRYRKLFKLKKTDYKGWARGLKKAGYATDKKYAEKLIRIIEELGLYQYDQI